MDKTYILNLSYGKDSMACLEAIKRLNWRLDRIVHAELMVTDTISVDSDEMNEFKEKADKIILERYGIKVEHLKGQHTYEDLFYRKNTKGSNKGKIYGFPTRPNGWCVSLLKKQCLNFGKNSIIYLGIAVDEIERVKKHTRAGVKLPLVEIGWTEENCMKWCKENDLLSPIYEKESRGGCWCCSKQNLNSLRRLRKEASDKWEILLKFDKDSTGLFKPPHTVADYDKRFEMEDLGLVPADRTFRWEMLEKIKGGLKNE